MLKFIFKMFIRKVFGGSLAADHTKCKSLNNNVKLD